MSISIGNNVFDISQQFQQRLNEHLKGDKKLDSSEIEDLGRWANTDQDVQALELFLKANESQSLVNLEVLIDDGLEANVYSFKIEDIEEIEDDEPNAFSFGAPPILPDVDAAARKEANKVEISITAPPISVPEHKVGRQTNINTARTFNTEEESKTAFNNSKALLLNINNWENSANSIDTASFKVFDENGNVAKRAPQKGDFIRIDLTDGIDNYDWVQIEDIDTTKEDEVSIRVRPSIDPTEKPPSHETKHFFTSQSTNTFVLRRQGNEVAFNVHGRNEVGNGLVGGFKNNVAEFSGLQAKQWRDLGTGLLGLN